MLAVERRNRIEKLVIENGSVLVVQLAKQFDVTTETIRGDLLKLEKQGVLVRTYGGATLAESEQEIAISERDIINYKEKEKIGKCASQMIDDGDTIFLDASTSALHLARCIKNKKGLTVITNAGKVVSELSGCDGIHIVCIGGELNPKNMSFVGRVAEKMTRENYFADKFFFSCKGVTINRGLVDSSDSEAEIKRIMLENSEKSVFLCDHDKLGRLAVPVIANLDAIDCMITDSDPGDEWTGIIKDGKIDLIIVD